MATADRGTSRRRAGFPCQSREGLNISVGVSIGTSVLEQNAAKYLYRFGVLSPRGDRTDLKIIFTSVYYSRKLAEVRTMSAAPSTRRSAAPAVTSPAH